MSTKFVFLDYYISLTDPQAVATNAAADAAALAALPLNVVESGITIPASFVPYLESPVRASADFSAPIFDKLNRYGGVIVAPATRITAGGPAPYIFSDWFTGNNNFPINQSTFTAKSGGWFGISLLFGTTTHYFWRRNFILGTATPGGAGAPVPQPIARRRFIDGFELTQNGEGATSDAGLIPLRSASRTVDGIGYAMRNGVSPAKEWIPTHFIGGSVTSSWERFYINPRRFPSQTSEFWKTNGGASPTMGVVLSMQPGGQLAIGSTDPTGVYTSIASGGQTKLNTWHKIDCLVQYRGAGAAGTSRFRLYLNGAQIADIHGLPGLEEAASTHTRSALGRLGNIGGPISGLQIDFDDWMNADLPAADPVTGNFTGIDWVNGSHMQLVKPTGIAGGVQGAWTQTWDQLRQIPGDSVGTANFMTSSTVSDPLHVATDAAFTVDGLPGQIGIAAFVVALWATAGAAATQLGYKLFGAAEVLTNVTPTGPNFTQAFYNPAGVTAPPPLAGLELHVVHGTVAAQPASLGGLMAVVEVLGVFGPEDIQQVPPVVGAPVPVVVVGTGPHNAPYPSTPWAKAAGNPIAPYAIVSGTFNGSGAPVSLNFKYPVNWFFIRPLTGTIDGGHWWSSMVAIHRQIFYHWQSDIMTDALVDPNFAGAMAVNQEEIQVIIRLLMSLQSNAGGVVYQYIAVCDPGMRFMLNGAQMNNADAVNVVNALVDSKFLPEAAWLFFESLGTVGTGFQYKGIGHSVNNISNVDAAETAASLAFGLGSLTSLPAFASAAGLAYNLWRRDDGSGDPGLPRVVQLGTYTGNGSATRTISLSPASGRRPLYVAVCPHNAATLYRDPSHTGTISSTMAGSSNATTGIIGGDIDAITVGSTLNANGIVYDIFCLPGDTVAGNAGFSQNGEFVPVEPAAPTGSQFGTPSIDFPFVDPDAVVVVTPGSGEAPADLSTDLAANCTVATHKVCNIALGRLGISIQIANLGTDQTPEATQCRLFYTDAVEQTLREFPWPFATRYMALTLYQGDDEGNPVNGDWDFAYLPPVNMVFARRLVTQSGRAFDPCPATFKIGNDPTVGLILYTNEENAVLEYTTRPLCAAGAGDALFRDALAWKLAHCICPALAKDQKKEDHAFQMYLDAKIRASLAGSKEAQQEKNEGDADWIQARGSDVPWIRGRD